MPPQPPRDVPDVMLREPGAIKTFGVLHLVIAGYGILMGVISLVSTIFFQGLSKSLTTPRGAAGPSGADQEMAMMNYMNDLKVYTYVSLAFTFLLVSVLGAHFLEFTVLAAHVRALLLPLLRSLHLL